ncbi:SDR family NAD(P)-dependent oxidoreductase [Teredinibacter waterburyi]|uniref:SDR family NAD(P)-dependent oxidoreductase n=1 Tax=Teredinibacter waterburyi TaxID=1500538 RepID=UPI00165F27ED|nr:SDR family oxidoreductase [Teredinibacter waterburyi]
MKKDLSNKWAFVTGSSRGIGQQIALGLAQLGCNVIIHGRNLDNTQKTLELLAQYPTKSTAVAGELDSAASVAALISEVRKIQPNIDILYNNAAISCTSTPVFEFDMAVWEKVMQVNVLALAQLCNAFGPGMKERNWGRIANLSSGIADQPNLAPYSVSKAAVDKLTKDLAFEFKDTGVRINCIDPGWIRTDLGGPDAWEAVESVLPGVMAPLIIADNGPNGEYFCAQDYKFFD